MLHGGGFPPYARPVDGTASTSSGSRRLQVVLSCAMSVDGYIDDASPHRLRLSNDEDLDRVDAERAWSDAILVGAGTIRRDNPRLLVRSPARRAERTARGLPPNPTGVTITGSGDLDPSSLFFSADEATRLVYCPRAAVDGLRRRLEGRATVVGAGDPLDLRLVLADLTDRDVRRLMVEGGSMVHTEFLAEGLADELHLVVAPFFVGDSRAPRFVADGTFPNDMTLAETRRMGDLVLIRYLLKAPAGD
jgi:5-amino-6-(5-phosphoribosylamino)uracil reductase